jgi:hypothetical protein
MTQVTTADSGNNMVHTAVVERWLTSYIIDQLYLQMCDGPLVEHSCDVSACKHLQQMSVHYIEADTYTRLISLGNFEGRNAQYKPVFIIDAANFTPKLKEEIRIAQEDKSLHTIVTMAVFRIFKARHKMIFYEHIEANKLKWRIENI